jgi:TP901-1 family phage major tail protein
MSLKGSSLVLRKGTVAAGVQLVASRSFSLTINSELVDSTSADDMTNRWRQALAQTGIKSASVTITGILKDSSPLNTAFVDALAQTTDIYGIVIGTQFSLEGLFQITQAEASGEYNGITQYTFSLESAGDLTYAFIA